MIPKTNVKKKNDHEGYYICSPVTCRGVLIDADNV